MMHVSYLAASFDNDPPCQEMDPLDHLLGGSNWAIRLLHATVHMNVGAFRFAQLAQMLEIVLAVSQYEIHVYTISKCMNNNSKHTISPSI